MSEKVALAGVTMTRAGFVRPVDLSPLRGRGEMRGSSLLVESQDGRVAKDRRPDEWYLLLRFYLYGRVAHDGTAHADVTVGLDDNLQYLYDQHLTGSTIDIVYTRPDDSTREGTCTVESIDAEAHGSPHSNVMLLTYDITVEAGLLTEPS